MHILVRCVSQSSSEVSRIGTVSHVSENIIPWLLDVIIYSLFQKCGNLVGYLTFLNILAFIFLLYNCTIYKNNIAKYLVESLVYHKREQLC